jgi:hypothetical protein
MEGVDLSSLLPPRSRRWMHPAPSSSRWAGRFTPSGRTGRRPDRPAPASIDTEEVTGSIPVSPTIKDLWSEPGSSPGARLYGTCVTDCVTVPTGAEDVVHDDRAALDDRPNLLAVHQLNGRRAAVPHKPGDLFDRDSVIREQRHEAQLSASPADPAWKPCRPTGHSSQRVPKPIVQRDEDLRPCRLPPRLAASSPAGRRTRSWQAQGMALLPPREGPSVGSQRLLPPSHPGSAAGPVAAAAPSGAIPGVLTSNAPGRA